MEDFLIRGGSWNQCPLNTDGRLHFFINHNTKAAARDVDKELIAIYAERQRKPGFSFPADSDLEYSFADAFQYELTSSH